MTIGLVSTILSTLLSIPLIVVGIELIVAVFFVKHRESLTSATNAFQINSTYKILIPAHNEAGIILKTLTRLIAELPQGDPNTIVLIADNCTDNTAEIVQSFPIKVLERSDPDRRGKGYALDFGLRYLKESNQPPDIIVILDADCETDRESLQNLLHTVTEEKAPAQMIYLMHLSENATLKQKIAGFAWLVKNKIRLLGVNRMKLPVVLTGTGMAFPWKVLEQVKLAHGNIVEDMQLGIDCTLAGYPPVLCPNAFVYSYFPEHVASEQSQRTRWEHGHIQTIIQQTPRLVNAAIKQKSGYPLALVLDIGVPPLSLQILLTLTGLCLFSLLSITSGSLSAAVILGASFSFFSAMLGLAWHRYGRSYLSAHEIAGIPLYITSKLSIYLGFIFNRQKEWVRTDRDH